MIRGIPVKLYERVVIGVDEFNKEVYEPVPVIVDNVLVEPLTNEDIVTNESLYGKKATYRLCIPKGDAHNWSDCKVEFFGQTWQVFGLAQEYIEENLPLKWNKKVLVEQYG